MGDLQKEDVLIDVFGRLVSDGIRNEADIASHYPFNPERWRFYATDTSEANRIFLMYGTDTRYSHQRFDSTGEFDVHQIKPSANETLIFQTAETFRYVVGYEALVTQAININQDLQSGDVIRIGPFDGSDGYGLEFNSTLGEEQAEMFIMRNGTKLSTETVDVENIKDNFTRFGHYYAWYNIARYRTIQNFTSDGEQKNNILGNVSVDDATNRGPRLGNYPIRFEVTAGSGTSGLVLNVGSVAWQTLGEVTPVFRRKAANIETTSTTIDATDTWVPIAAIRKDPDRGLVNVQLVDLQVSEFTGTGDVRVVAMSVSSDKTDASGFSTPVEHGGNNSVIEQTLSVTTFPDNTGAVVGNASNPGGFQVGYDALYSTGTGTGNRQISSVNVETKRNLYDGDIIVLLANATVTGDVKIDYITEQNW